MATFLSVNVLDAPATPTIDTPTPAPSRPESFEYPDTPLSPRPLVEPEDIYRNREATPAVPLRARRISIVSNTASSVTSSSTESSARGPIAGLAALVERAISRWARPSSISSASDSSASLISYPTYRRPPHTPRLFTLLLPDSQDAASRLVQSENLALILAKLDEAGRKRTRHRKEGRDAEGRERVRRGKRREGKVERKGKGKSREPDTSRSRTPIGGGEPSTAVPPEPVKPRAAWWLDVASPTSHDMRALGKFLHLHPLTLEDILYQDPREKTELFPRLGYYLVVFRAIPAFVDDLPDFEGRTLREGIGLDELGSTKVEGVSVYLVVFADGICSFHFHDFAEHVAHVRDRALRLETMYTLTPDWIAHGLIDSIVDAFFPFITRIEREVDKLQSVLEAFDSPKEEGGSAQAAVTVLGTRRITSLLEEKAWDDEKPAFDEKNFSPSPPDLGLPKRKPLLPLLRNLGMRVLPLRVRLRLGLSEPTAPKPPNPRIVTLYRIAAARRLVTSITRLLAHKSAVVGSLRRRFSGAKGAKGEVRVYLDDVQDHILQMQQALMYCDGALTQLQPGYLSHLKLAFESTKNGMDRKLIYLTIITVAILAIQVWIGLFSINVHLPRNNRGPCCTDTDTGPLNVFNVFGIVVAGSIIIASCLVGAVRYWWVEAKKQHREKTKLR